MTTVTVAPSPDSESTGPGAVPGPARPRRVFSLSRRRGAAFKFGLNRGRLRLTVRLGSSHTVAPPGAAHWHGQVECGPAADGRTRCNFMHWGLPRR